MWIYGNGGHAQVVRDLADYCGEDVLALLDDSDKERQWNDLYARIGTGFIAIGDNKSRQDVYKRLAKVEPHPVFKTLVHPQSTTPKPWKYRRVLFCGDGVAVMAGSVIQPHAKLGNFSIINTCASVDHHCSIGDFVHIAPGAHLCGNVTVGEGTLVGAGTIVTPGVTIGPWLVIPAGSIVTKDCLNADDVAALRKR